MLHALPPTEPSLRGVALHTAGQETLEQREVDLRVHVVVLGGNRDSERHDGSAKNPFVSISPGSALLSKASRRCGNFESGSTMVPCSPRRKRRIESGSS